jgi:hypothetical protein
VSVIVCACADLGVGKGVPIVISGQLTVLSGCWSHLGDPAVFNVLYLSFCCCC